MKFELFKNFVPGTVEVLLHDGTHLTGCITSHLLDKETMIVTEFKVMTATATIDVKSSDVAEIKKTEPEPAMAGEFDFLNVDEV